jgi:hypothetical protein
MVRFCEEIARPASVVGPEDLRELGPLAASWASETGRGSGVKRSPEMLECLFSGGGACPRLALPSRTDREWERWQTKVGRATGFGDF